ncbi:MAG: Peptidoglycan glycosyltransferase [Candidatus Moranbacteria bacterium GW2011_GWA2_39_41]|nr:MAG: Peptidoglycan glycosyltransferase [Candidatus Moranbacteria bacterium GW2011_GWA2_39_41]
MFINKKSSGDIENWRIYLLTSVFFAIVIVFLFRFYALQFVQREQYRSLADGQHSFFQNLIPNRGEIFMQDKSGIYPAAVNRETKMAYAVPKEIENPSDAASAIASILQIDALELKEKFEKEDDAYESLKHRLSDEEIDGIKNLKLKGIHLSEESYRYYPSNELASNVLGFVGWKDDALGGRYGLEAYFDEDLKGVEGSLFHERDASGSWIGVGQKEITEARNGNTIFLTIDHIVQYQTERIIKNAVEKYGADGGNITVMEPTTGKILAMANFPTFNPNDYAKVENINAFRNPAVNDAYESGSVFKTFTIAAGLDSEKITPDTTYTDTGSVNEAGYTIRNSDLKANGVQTMTEVLEKSLNTGVIYVEKLLGNKNFADYVKRFGFGEQTGIELIGESRGNINNLKNLKSDIQFFTASFGQGITVTPIQLASAYSSIANGGILLKPQIVDKIVYGDGREEKIKPQEVRRVISQKAAMQTAQILRSVAVKGHGKRADVPGFLIGGKTGTAQIVDAETKNYSEGKSTGSFGGFAPINDPKFTIIVKLDNPRNVEWAESSAAPAFGELMKFLLEYYDIEPTEEYTQKNLDDFNQTHTLTQFKKEDAEAAATTVAKPEVAEIKKDKKR